MPTQLRDDRFMVSPYSGEYKFESTVKKD